MPDAHEQQDFLANAQPSTPARAVPDSVGGEMRAAREGLGQDIDEVSAALKIRANHIDAIEQGRFGDLPGQTYAIGFVRTYATYLGLDADDTVRRFKAEVVGLDDQTELVFRAPEREARLPFALIVIASLLVAVLIYALWFYVVREPDPEPLAGDDASPAAVMNQPEAPDANAQDKAAEDAAAAPAQPTEGWADGSGIVSENPPPPTGRPAEATENGAGGTDAAERPASVDAADAIPGASAAEEPAAPAADTGSGIVIHAIDDSWVQIRARDGEILLSRVLSPGERYAVPDRPGLTMVTGNAGAIRITVDGRTTPPLGEEGVVRRDIELTAQALRQELSE